MYFTRNFPTIDYDPTGSGDTKKIHDIITRIKVRDGIRERASMFAKHDVMEGQSPEMLSYNYYGDVKYYWTILLLNKMYNRFYDWPMTERHLREYVSDTYSDPGSVHHYEVAQSSGDTTVKLRVESDAVGAAAVTNFEYERELNDNRKSIMLLQTTYLSQFVNEYGKLLKSAKTS